MRQVPFLVRVIVKLGIFGGTFDPPHLAHLIAGELAVEQFELDRLIFVPANRSPLKDRHDVSTASHRMEMMRLATAGNPRFEVSPVEIDRSGASFTVDTLRAIQQQEKPKTMHLFIGRDQFVQFERWKEPDEIVRLATVVVMARPSDASGVSTRFDAQVEYLRMPLLELSATEIRRKVKAGESIRYQVPESVREYIEQHQLYL